ncbi:MAG: hypothetical protein KDE31_08170 [Caldilineaceae bacterium]|nr:hypothetical protein [Caldilineaceae bacterium]
MVTAATIAFLLCRNIVDASTGARVNFSASAFEELDVATLDGARTETHARLYHCMHGWRK